MSGVSLMREASLLAAACHLAEPADRVPTADAGWAAQAAAREDLCFRMERHERDPDVVRLRLIDELGLGLVDYWLVMLCTAVELHPEAAAAISLLTDDARQQLPTPTVVAKLLRGIRGTSYQQALAAALGGGLARAAGLVELQETPAGTPHSQQPLRMNAEELRAVVADSRADGAAELEGYAATVVVPQRVTGFAAAVVAPAQRLLDRRGLLLVRGSSRRGCRQFACDLATDRGRSAALITVAADPEHPVRPPGVAQLARARTGAGDALVVVDLHSLPSVPPGVLAELARSAQVLTGLVVLVDESVDTADLAAVEAPAIDFPAARRIWSGLLPDDRATAMALRFRVGVEEAATAAREVADLADRDDAGDTLLAERVRAQGARRMGRHVAVVTSTARLSDLVVPEALALELNEIIAWQCSSHRVRWEMGLGVGDPIGTGLTCLFSGKSGTGKTFAARCLANELGLNLYRIDLSQVVSKYIGETEKALAQIFDEVEAGHGLLLFDEADALFGRRSEVKDAHDRYANIEVGYLLQRLEVYDGLAVLTTNLQGNMDTAFVRRLRFILQFPAPDRDLRRRLWEQSLPTGVWRDDELQLDLLSDRFQLSGGAIHNIGLAAAHLAASTTTGRITVHHLARATQRELQKSGRPSDVGTLEQLVRTLPEVTS